jgi:Domain of unknown function (DUF4389)
VTDSLATTAGGVENTPQPPLLLVERILRRRRLSVAFRLLLALPQFVVLYVLSLVGALFIFIGWFAALILGRLPEWIAQFLCYFVGYGTRIYAYILLLTDQYPPFQLSAVDYPVRVELAPGRLNRLAVLFRLLLVIPAQLLASLMLIGYEVAAFFVWLLVLLLGRVPGSLFDATTALLRYNFRYYAYSWLLTAEYPWGLFGDRPTSGAPAEQAAAAMTPPGPAPAAAAVAPAGPAPAAGQATLAAPLPEAAPTEAALAGRSEQPEHPWIGRRLVLSPGARRLLILFLVLGAASLVTGGTLGAIAGARTAGDTRTLAAVVSAHKDLGRQLEKSQRDVVACNQDLGCVQSADGELAAAFEGFATEVDGLEFSASAQDEAAEVGRAAHEVARALQRLVATSSPEEYLRLSGGIEQIGDSFDQRYDALVDELTS